jgi:hypothetical protein
LCCPRKNWIGREVEMHEKKAMISTAGTIAFGRVKEAGMKEFSLLSE